MFDDMEYEMSLKCKVITLKVCWDGGCLYLIFDAVGNAETKTNWGEGLGV